MNGVEFDDLRWLHLLWAVLGVAGVGAYGIWQRHRAMRLFASMNLLPRLVPRVGLLRRIGRLTLVVLCLVSLVAAIIHPRWGETQQKVVTRGIDVMVLLDVSRSMLARDIAPNRLERAKLSIRDDLLPVLGGDRLGIIAFAGVPTLKCPLTNDYGFVRLVLDDLDVHSAPRGGSLIGDAIRRADEAFDDKLDTHKVVLLISDGEDHESYPLEAARKLWQEDRIPVVAVALGDERDGARVPAPDGEGEYMQYEGETVWSRAHFDTLRAVAALSGLPGAFIPVGTRNFDLGQIYREVIVPAIEVKERQEAEHIDLPSRYHPFAVAALLLLLVESFLPDVRRRERARIARTGLSHREEAA